MAGGAVDSGAVPERVREAAEMTLQNVEELTPGFIELLSLATPDVLAELSPLQRAESLLLLARATTTLFALRLRCTGVHPDDHPVKSEMERLCLYQDKLERFVDLSKVPLRPSATLNYQAATRFIQHNLPDLAPEQRKSMKDISREQGPRIKYTESSAKKKRKYQSSEKTSVMTATKEFLEKAARELLGDNRSGFTGPLQNNLKD